MTDSIFKEFITKSEENHFPIIDMKKVKIKMKVITKMRITNN